MFSCVDDSTADAEHIKSTSNALTHTLRAPPFDTYDLDSNMVELNVKRLPIQIINSSLDSVEDSIVYENDEERVDSTVTVRKRKHSVDTIDCAPVTPEQYQEVFYAVQPRVLKTDIRRDYPSMFLNVLNSCDSNLLGSYISSYYTPNFALMQRNGVIGLDPIIRSEISGANQVKEYWAAKMTAYPDLVLTMKHAQVKLQPDGTSIVTIGMVFSGSATVTMHNALELLSDEKYVAGQGLNPKRGAVPHVKEILLQQKQKYDEVMNPGAPIASIKRRKRRPWSLSASSKRRHQKLLESSNSRKSDINAVRRETPSDVIRCNVYAKVWRAIGCGAVLAQYGSEFPLVTATKSSSSAVVESSSDDNSLFDKEVFELTGEHEDNESEVVEPLNNVKDIPLPALISSYSSSPNVPVGCDKLPTIAPQRIEIRVADYAYFHLHLDADSRVVAIEKRSMQQDGYPVTFNVSSEPNFYSHDEHSVPTQT